MKLKFAISLLMVAGFDFIGSAQTPNHEQIIASTFQKICIDTKADVSRIESQMNPNDWAELKEFDILSLIPQISGPDYKG